MLGKPVQIKEDVQGTIRMLIRKGWTDNAFNQFVSDLISVDRTLPDFREDWYKSEHNIYLGIRYFFKNFDELIKLCGRLTPLVIPKELSYLKFKNQYFLREA